MNRDDDRYITIRDIPLHEITQQDIAIATGQRTILGFDQQTLGIFLLLILSGVMVSVFSYLAGSAGRTGFIELGARFSLSQNAVLWTIGVFGELGTGLIEAGLLFGLLEMTWRQRQDRDLVSSIATRAEIAELHETIDEMRDMLVLMVESQRGGGGEQPTER